MPMPNEKLPEIIVFAGPNGSGKSTITKLAKIIEPYINADVMHVYDNSNIPFRIFKKRKNEQFIWENKYWNENEIEKLVGIK